MIASSFLAVRVVMEFFPFFFTAICVRYSQNSHEVVVDSRSCILFTVNVARRSIHNPLEDNKSAAAARAPCGGVTK